MSYDFAILAQAALSTLEEAMKRDVRPSSYIKKWAPPSRKSNFFTYIGAVMLHMFETREVCVTLAGTYRVISWALRPKEAF
jgi:hypothetical protein